MMAATGSNHEERPLAQPPKRFRSSAPAGRRFRVSIVVLAIMLAVGLSLFVFSVVGGGAATATAGLSAAASSAPVVAILFPLEQRISWTDTFGAARDGGRTHAGNDLMCPKMTPELAVVDGTLDWMNLTGKLSSYNNLPYYNILLHGDDGNDYFYIHINNDTPGTDDGKGGPENAYAPGLTNGSHVKRGQVIAYAGDSGNAEDAGSHLHFEIHLGGYVSAGAGQTRTPSAIDPYLSLKAAPTLSEWIAAGKPPLTTSTTIPGADTTSSTTTTTTKPTTTTTTTKPTTTTTKPPTTSTTVKPPTTSTTAKPTTTTLPADTRVPGFTDVYTTDWFYDDFAQARAAGVVTDSSDQRFRPYSVVPRALFTVYLVRTIAPAELEKPAASAAAAPRFHDVDSSYWAYNEIEVAGRLGLVKGTGNGGTFSPEAKVTRAQMATMICRALDMDVDGTWAGEAVDAHKLYNDVPEDYWAQGAIVMVDYLGLMKGDAAHHFRPVDSTTRAQAVTVMARIMRMLEGGSGS